MTSPSLLPLPFTTLNFPPWYPHLHASLLTLCYVGGFYLSPSIRNLRKDDPRVMKSRLRVASIVSLLALVVTGGVLWRGQPEGERRAGNWIVQIPRLFMMMGMPLPLSTPTVLTDRWIPLKPGLGEYLTGHLVPAIILPLALTMSLYAGPLYVEYLEGSLPLPKLQASSKVDQGALAKIKSWLKGWWNLHGLRNFVVGPATEEVVWRACILSVYAFSGTARKHLIFATPLWFGIAHLHHFFETYITRSPTLGSSQALQFAALQSTVQFTYTTLFGWYANYLFLRTGNLVPPLLSHVFCNIMGLPNPAADAKRWPAQEKRIWAMHALGIALFAAGLQRVTRPNFFGGSVFWQVTQ